MAATTVQTQFACKFPQAARRVVPTDEDALRMIAVLMHRDRICGIRSDDGIVMESRADITGCGSTDRTQKTIGLVEAYPQYSPQPGFERYSSSFACSFARGSYCPTLLRF